MRKIFAQECNRCCFAAFAFDVNFGNFVPIAVVSIFAANYTFFYNNNFIKALGSFLLKILRTSYEQSSLSDIKKTKNKRKRINFKSKKQLNSVLIKNNKILVIFFYLQKKSQRFWNIRVLLRTVKTNYKVLIVDQVKKKLSFSLLQVYVAAKKA